MIWPWQKHRRDEVDARRRADDAEKRALAATRRRELAERQALVAQQVTKNLREQIEKNGWTELLQAAWGGR